MKTVRERSFTSLVWPVLFAVLLNGCERRPPATPAPQPSTPTLEIVDPAMDNATVGVWLHSVAILDNALTEARQLHGAVQQLLQSPSEATLGGARLAWHRSHNAYQEFELLVALSESNPGLFAPLLDHDFALDAWPLQPGYLDYFDVYTHSGIVNDIAMPLTAEALRQQHGFTDASDVSLGFHALEYLLWGEAGTRPASDYAPASLDNTSQSAGVRTVDLPNNRRRVLLELLSRLLMDDLETFKQAVENPNGLLRRSYMTLQGPSRVALMRQAGHGVLTHHLELLTAQLEEQTAVDEAGDYTEGLHHNLFAGGDAQSLAHSLKTVEEVLLENEIGLGDWLTENTEGLAAAKRDVTELRTALLEWHDRPWPPQAEKGEAMVESLENIAELLEPAPLTEPDL